MPSFCSRFPLLYRLGAFLALWAILVPIATGLAHYPSATQAIAHICGVDQQGNDGQGKAPTHKLPSCPICQSLHLLGAGALPPSTFSVALLSFVRFESRVADYDPLLKPVAVPQARPRAPPVLV